MGRHVYIRCFYVLLGRVGCRLVKTAIATEALPFGHFCSAALTLHRASPSLVPRTVEAQRLMRSRATMQVVGKNANGEGSITYDKKRRRHRVPIETPQGTVRKHVGWFKTRQAAHEALTEALSRGAAPDHAGCR